MAAARTVLSVPLFLFCLFLIPLSAKALEPMDESEMDSVRAQSGIAAAADNVRIYMHKSHQAYRDTSADGNAIELKNILFSDGQSAPMRFHTPEPVIFRVFQNMDGRGVAGLSTASWDQDLYIDAETLLFCGHDMGSLHFHGFRPEEFAFYASPLGEGGGVGFQAEVRAELKRLRWRYNDADDAADFSGFYMAETFEHPDDDPQEPGTWQPHGRFVIGDLKLEDDSSYEPAGFRVLNDADGAPAARFELPATKGSVRVADISMGGQDLGPMIIDGIHIHELLVDFVPAPE